MKDNNSSSVGTLTAPEGGWHRYVAIGDSFTEGMCDAHPSEPETFVGWADRLAGHLAAVSSEPFSYANLAVRGRLLHDVTHRQLPLALDLQPDLVSIVGGGNDILRPRADIDALAEELEAAVSTIRATGADVLLATPSDPAAAPVIRHVRGRHAVYSAHIWSIARRHGCAVIDQWGARMLLDWRLWAPDRIHLTTEGHRRIALAAYAALGYDPGDAEWSTPLPPAPPARRRDRLRDDSQWLHEYVGPWVQRRIQGRSSGDGRTAKRPALQLWESEHRG
ncbi:SGNH/GDSL hydrolase family protein [Gephyromycinifex aptenodytis]|uniref:SGNH/GDSL hydrolase family protein n=1 Tax=Gephyromycinifex aptenodytis TaxID=2716227 RepID=UPI00385571EC